MTRNSKLYHRRIIITVPNTGALFLGTCLVASATIPALRVFPIVSNAVALFLGVMALVVVWIANRQVARMRDEVDMILRGVTEDIDAPIMQDLPADLKVVNDPDFVRVPGH